MRYTTLLERTTVCRARLHNIAPLHIEGRVSGLSGLVVDIDGLTGLAGEQLIR